jgi:hypothetical protein
MFLINEQLQGTLDYEAFKSQLLGFPNDHDDGPDAFESAIFDCKSTIRQTRMPVFGQYERQNEF